MKKIIIYITLIIAIIINIIFLSINIYNHLQIKKVVREDNYILKLNGENIIKLNINEKYQELGAINTKDIKTNVKIDGFVDTKKIDSYLIRYYIKNENITDYSIYRLVKVIDDKAPVIKLKGKSTLNIYVGDKYKEQGVDVTDNSNESLNSKVVMEGEVNTKKVGKYKITYSVADSSGNKSSITRTINVKNRPITTKRPANKVSTNEKGGTTNKKVDLNKNTNTITNMKFTNNGISIEGYVKIKSNNYVIKLCKESNCINTEMNSNDSNYYYGNINLLNLDNGTYKMKIVADNEMDVVDELPFINKIVRAKIGSKLVTVDYPNNNPTIKIENFSYQYDILIDAGHGGSDTGATNKFITEKDLNLEQSLYEKRRYEEHGLKVKMIRSDDTYGIMMGNPSDVRVHQRAYAMGYYGVVSKYVYSNHHNSINNDYYSGYEILLANQGTKSDYAIPYKIANIWKENYPLNEDHLRIYGRNYDTDSLLNKTNGEVYQIRNYYAVIRIPYELYNIYTVIYEGCYLSNLDDYNWYKENYKKMSEIKIKTYVESLGISYKAVDN